MTTKTKDLPFDVIYQILWRLPTKSLLRFRCLSNLYQETIDDSEFIRTHNRVGRTLLFKQNGISVSQLEESDGEILRPTIVSPITYYERARFLCSAEGFIVLFLQDNKICLCNPSRRESIVLPSAPIDIEKTSVGFFLRFRTGLGFDSTMKEYKIVCNLRENIEDTETDTLIYSSKSKSWKITSSSLPLPRGFDISGGFPNRGVFVNGSIYWIEYSYYSVPLGFHLVSFDIKTEEFKAKEFSLPKFDLGTLPALMELGGCLAMADCGEVLGYTSVGRLWVLIEGNWAIKNIVEIDDQDKRCCFDQETYRAYYYVNDEGFMWTWSRKFIKKYPCFIELPQIHRCKETLLSLNNF